MDGRILTPPTIAYAANKSVSPSSGSWNMIQQKFSTGTRIANWSYFKIQFGDRDPLDTPLPGLMREFRTMMENCGLRVEAPNPGSGFPDLKLNASQPHTHEAVIDQRLSNVRSKSGTRMLLVVLPTKSQALYASVKYLADVRYGLSTVCSVASKLQTERGRPQYLANVALKWNLKGGGVNQQLPSNKMGILSTSKTMVVGIDVTHPSPGSREAAPSVAGVVASVDEKYGQWPASVRCQESRKEMVSELEDMIVERLRVWQKRNAQALPQNILVYRDGVSEGQYQTVLDEESPAFDRAITRVYPANRPRPKVSIIVVGKRHHTRFYPTKEEDTDRSGNPKNGTVVDRGITSERHWDFFLQAHTGLQGTARPAHYVVVQDQISLGADGLEQLVHIPSDFEHGLMPTHRPTICVTSSVGRRRQFQSVRRPTTPTFYASALDAICTTRSIKILRLAVAEPAPLMPIWLDGLAMFIQIFGIPCFTSSSQRRNGTDTILHVIHLAYQILCWCHCSCFFQTAGFQATALVSTMSTISTVL